MQHRHEQRLCYLADIPNQGILALDSVWVLAGADVLLARTDDRVSAFHNMCPHAGRRLDWAPGEFLLRGRVLTCAAHGACFEVDTGACLGGPCRGEGLQAIAVDVRDGAVWLVEAIGGDHCTG